MHENRIYLDYNATTPVSPAVAEKVAKIISYPHNASSIHGYGREARKIIDTARRNVADFVNAVGGQIIFTSSGTEANNLALKGLAREGFGGNIITSAIEHTSVLTPARKLGAKITPVDENGIVILSELEEILKKGERSLVSVMMANNETGVIQPIREIVELVHSYAGYVHSDAAQAISKMPVDFSKLGLDMMTISSHKFGGIQGAGALILRKGLKICSELSGGGQEYGLRAGTENIPAIAALGLASEFAMERCHSGEAVMCFCQMLRDYLEKEIKSYAPNVVIFGEDVERLYNTTSVAMPGMSGETQLISFDIAGIAVSSGAACSSGKVEHSHVLRAMGVNDDLASSAIRISIGRDTNKSEIDSFLHVWKSNYDHIKERNATVSAKSVRGKV